MALDDYSNSSTLQKQTQTQTETQTLNVFLHGTFVFLEQKAEDEIRAVIPRIDHHTSRAGSWLGETDLQPGVYRLQGVLTGTGQFDNAQNMILPLRQQQYEPDLAYATLILPRPDRIISLRVANIPANAFENATELKVNQDGEHIATLQIFTYRFVNDDKLFLETEQKNAASEIAGHYWEPAFTGDHINLHIFSAEDHHQGPSHAAEDFQACMAVLGLKLTLKRAQSAGGIKEDETLPAGVIAEETEDLAPRTARMARLGRLLRNKGDLNQAWFKNDALDDDPPACGGFIGH